MRTSTYTRIGNLMALFTERYTRMEGYGPQNPLPIPNDMGLGGEHQSCTRTALRDAKFAADWLQRVPAR